MQRLLLFFRPRQKRGAATSKRGKFAAPLISLVAALALPYAYSNPIHAQDMPADVLFGYKTYFKFHPPSNKPVQHNLYPFGGTPVPYGADIPLCNELKTPAAYEKRPDLKFLMHGKDGWIFRSVDFRTGFTASPDFLSYLTRLNKMLAAKDETLLVMLQPPRAMAGARHIDPADARAEYTPERAREGYEEFIRQLKDADIATVDLSDADDSYFGKGDVHWSPAGAAFSAHKAAAAIEKTSTFDDVKRHDFDLIASGIGVPHRGALEEFVQNACHLNIELQSGPVWSSAARGHAPAEAPAITALGSGNTAEDDRFAFVGALKRDLRADVYNAALPTGGFAASPVQYFASDKYHAYSPKVIVWEIPPQYNYDDTDALNALRQMIPAVHGTCQPASALSKFAGPITGAVTPILPDAGKLSLEKTYLSLSVTEPVDRNLKLEILYSDGNADQVDLTRPAGWGNNGRYFFELGGAGAHALFFHLVTDKPSGRVTARICPYPVNVAEK